MLTKHDEAVNRVREIVESEGLDPATLAAQAAEIASLEGAFDRKFRLSDAMRLGARGAPQAQGSWGDGDTMCALHAAVSASEALGIEL